MWLFNRKSKETGQAKNLKELNIQIDNIRNILTTIINHQAKADAELKNIYKEIATLYMAAADDKKALIDLRTVQTEVNIKTFQWIYCICAELRKHDIQIPESPVPESKELN